MGKLTDKVAIVTGSGQGIGKGIAEALAGEGAKVVIASISSDEVAQVVEEFRSENWIAEGVVCDVTSKEQVYASVERAVDVFGTVDILVNNAQSFGTAEKPVALQPLKSIEEYIDEEWEHSWRSGLMSTVWGMRAVFPHMKDKGGKVINMSSPASLYGQTGAAPYSATKAGIGALSRVAAQEWGQYQINVNVIVPVIMTQTLRYGMEAHAKASGQEVDMTPQNVLGRFGEPLRDVGPLAVYLSSSDSDFMTGKTLEIDGGFYLHP